MSKWMYDTDGSGRPLLRDEVIDAVMARLDERGIFPCDFTEAEFDEHFERELAAFEQDMENERLDYEAFRAEMDAENRDYWAERGSY